MGWYTKITIGEFHPGDPRAVPRILRKKLRGKWKMKQKPKTIQTSGSCANRNQVIENFIPFYTANPKTSLKFENLF